MSLAKWPESFLISLSCIYWKIVVYISKGLFKPPNLPTIGQQQLDNDYVAKNPLSPTAASEAAEQMLPTNGAASRVTSPEARSPSTSANEPQSGAPTLKTTQTLELIQRLVGLTIFIL